MDNKWIHSSKLSAEYEMGVRNFIKFLFERFSNKDKVKCPCLKCCHGSIVDEGTLYEHLICNGVDKSPFYWKQIGVSYVEHIGS